MFLQISPSKIYFPQKFLKSFCRNSSLTSWPIFVPDNIQIQKKIIERGNSWLTTAELLIKHWTENQTLSQVGRYYVSLVNLAFDSFWYSPQGTSRIPNKIFSCNLPRISCKFTLELPPVKVILASATSSTIISGIVVPGWRRPRFESLFYFF